MLRENLSYSCNQSNEVTSLRNCIPNFVTHKHILLYTKIDICVIYRTQILVICAENTSVQFMLLSEHETYMFGFVALCKCINKQMPTKKELP